MQIPYQNNHTPSALRRGWLIFLLAVLSVFPSFAQEREIQLVKASGGEFMVSDGEEQRLYQPGSVDPEGLTLRRGNMLQTGAGSFAEIRIGEITLLAAENTSVAFRGDFLEFVYGRLRLYGSGTAVVRTAAADVIFECGDTGLDYVYETFRTGFSEPVLRVYGFTGESELVFRGDRASAPGYRVAEAAMLSLRYTAAHSYAERGGLGEEIVNYWNRYGGGPLLSLPVKEEVEKSEPEIQIRYETPDFGPYRDKTRYKNASILTGTLFVLLGGAVTAFGRYGPKQITGRYANAINTAGYSSIGLGVFTFFGSMLINPDRKSVV
jgi:hypothetical protein